MEKMVVVRVLLFLTVTVHLSSAFPPEVSLFQNDSFSPVVCHATGFCPRAVMISWQNNGEDLHEHVDLRETLRNQDGTFQKRSILTVSPEELKNNHYTCVVQHGGLEISLERKVLKGSWSRQSTAKNSCPSPVPPKVDLFQNDSFSPVVCHATGFCPRAVMITWQKNGEDLHEDVDLRETLPNQDGTFQKRSILTVSPEELKNNNYTCVVQHEGLEISLERKVLKGSRHRRSTDENSCPSPGTTPKNSGTHSLQYFYTAVTPGIDFPEFTEVGLVDGEPITYYDSKIKEKIPKTGWIKNINADDPDYWNSGTQILRGSEESFKVGVDILMKRFNHTKGVHTVQYMYGCELDDDGTKRGYLQYGYDGEDFVSLDLKTGIWIAPTPQAVPTKHKWDDNVGYTNYWRNTYLQNVCIEWLQKYVGYGRDTLERKVPPKVDLFQKDPSSPVVCHATGFFPKHLNISWQKNGEDLHEDVVLRETLRNQDGTFQQRSILTVSPEELDSDQYTCVVQHGALKEDVKLPVSERRVLSEKPDSNNNEGGRSVEGEMPVGVIVGVVVAALIALGAGVGVVIWKKKKNPNQDPGFKRVPGNPPSDTSSDTSKI